MPAFTGQNSSVTTSAAALGASAAVNYYTVVKAAPTNTAAVYVGVTAGVTASTGYALFPGESEAFPVAFASNVNALFVVSGSGTQAVSYQGL